MKIEVVGAEIKSNLAGDAETKLNSKVSFGATAGPVSGKVEGGLEISSKGGNPLGGKATLNGVGVKVNENGVSPVVEKTAEMKLGAEAGAGLKVGVALNLSKIGEIYDALKVNVPIVVGAALNQMIPGAGTAMSIGQLPPAASSLKDLPRSMVMNPIDPK